MTCTLPDLLATMKRVKIETTDRVCPEHRVHLVRNGKVNDDLRVSLPEVELIVPTTVNGPQVVSLS